MISQMVAVIATAAVTAVAAMLRRLVWNWARAVGSRKRSPVGACLMMLCRVRKRIAGDRVRLSSVRGFAFCGVSVLVARKVRMARFCLANVAAMMMMSMKLGAIVAMFCMVCVS